MEEKNKKILVVAAAILVLAGAAYFMFFQPGFESEYATLGNSWKLQGVSCAHLHGCDELFELEKPELEQLNESIQSFNSSSSLGSAKEISSVYSLLVTNAISLKAIEAEQPNLESGNEFCDRVKALEKVGAEFSKLRENRDLYIEKINSFNAEFPMESETISLREAEVQMPENEQQLLLLIQLAELMGGECE